jgi:hypothetical protein
MAGKMAKMNDSLREASELQEGALTALSEQMKIDLSSKGASLEKRLKKHISKVVKPRVVVKQATPPFSRQTTLESPYEPNSALDLPGKMTEIEPNGSYSPEPFIIQSQPPNNSTLSMMTDARTSVMGGGQILQMILAD